MADRLPPLNSLRAFEAAARHLSISSAAEELFVTHSAVSRHVAKLEDYLGAKLFVRDNHRLSLTPRGESYAKRISQSFDQIRAATAESFCSRVGGNRLRIGIYPTLATHMLIPRLARYRERFPQVAFELITSHQDQNPVGSEIDLAVRLGAGGWSDLATDLLCHEELIPVASPKLMCGRRIEEAQELGEYPLLHAVPRSNDWQNWFRFAGVSGCDPHRGMHFEHSGLVYQAALNALGVAMAQTIHVRSDLQLGSLQQLYGKPLRTERSYYLVYAKERGRDPKIQSFVHWLTDEIASMPVVA